MSTSFRTFPTAAMAVTEFKLIVRRPGTLSIGLLVPALLIGLTFLGDRPDGAQGWGGTIGSQIVIALLLTVYLNVATLTTSRRENLVFKRLRTSELSGVGLVLSIGIPFALLGVLQVAFLVGADVATGATVPRIPGVLALVVVLGIVGALAAAAMTAALTTSTERIQFTTIPIFLGGAVGAQVVSYDVSNTLEWVVLALPLVALADLVDKGWAGMDSGITTLPAGLGVPVVMVDICLIVAWTVIGLAVAGYKWRWEPRS